MISPCTSVNRLMRRTALLPIIAVAVISGAVVVLSAQTSEPPSQPGRHDDLKAVPHRHASTMMAQSGVAGVGIA